MSKIINKVRVPVSPLNTLLTPAFSGGLLFCVRLCVRYSLKLCYKSIGILSANSPPNITAQPIAGFLKCLPYAIA